MDIKDLQNIIQESGVVGARAVRIPYIREAYRQGIHNSYELCRV